MLLQIVLGGLGGLFVFAKLFWHRMRAFFFRRGNASIQAAASATDQIEPSDELSEDEHKRAA